MKSQRITVLILLLATVPGFASDPVGIYALIDQVVTEPADGPAERVQLHGAFSIAEGKRGGKYTPPVWGIMYFSLPAEAEDADRARAVWIDLASMAGSGKVAAFSWRYQDSLGTVRTSASALGTADVYPLGRGVQEVRPRGKWNPALKLVQLPRPTAPQAHGMVEIGTEVVLRCGNPVQVPEGAKLHFSVTLPDGSSLASPAVTPGSSTTQWKPGIQLVAGKSYAWSVWIAGADLEGPKASSSFTAVEKKTDEKKKDEKKKDATEQKQDGDSSDSGSN